MSAIILDNIYKHYHLYSNDYQRLVEVITGKPRAKVIKALNPVSLHVERGEVLGVVGNNGAGKSTLLKLITGTASPTGGSRHVNGRITALLELGSGFHPELTGHENIYLSGSVLGIGKSKMDELYDEIIEFSGIGDFIHQPVKTYSSGMFVRLAFSVATAVDPDILIIDEALSVGDGRFAKKSFDRIMSFKAAGKTIIFCSHALFHIENICNRVIWIDDGEVKMDGKPELVIPAYSATMRMEHSETHNLAKKNNNKTNGVEKKHDKKSLDEKNTQKIAQFLKINVNILDGKEGENIVQSGETSITIQAEFESDLSIQTPNFSITITDENDFNVSSACTMVDGFSIPRDKNGYSQIELNLPKINLLKGYYHIYAYLMCENCIFIYEAVPRVMAFQVKQNTQEVGIVRLPHTWSSIE